MAVPAIVEQAMAALPVPPHRRSSQATARPIAVASKSLGMSTTTPVLTAPGVALNEMPAPSLPCCRQSPYARPPSFRAALSFSKVLTC